MMFLVKNYKYLNQNDSAAFAQASIPYPRGLTGQHVAIKYLKSTAEQRYNVLVSLKLYDLQRCD